MDLGASNPAQALAAVERERDRARRYLEAAQTMLIGLDPAHRIALINRTACEVLGRDEGDLIGKDWIESVVAPEHRALAASEFRNLLARQPRKPQHCEYAVINPAGQRRWIVWRCVMVEEPGHADEVLCSGDDVTDSREAELAVHVARERMMSVSRLATMGEMASGIAHELNQPLAAIANYAQASLRLLDSGATDLSDLAEAQEQIAAQALRAGDIIRRLRNLTRTREAEREYADVNEVILELEPLTRADARASGARVVMQMAESLPRVRLDRLQIQQVVLNLVRNAIDAVSHSPVDQREVIISTREPEPASVQVSVLDSGSGVEESLRERLFTPFLTTKKNGTGLGLAASRTIVETHRGRLDYRPNRPTGSEFVMTLPATDASLVVANGHGPP